MIPILIIISLAIVLTDSIQLSLKGWKAASLWSLVWMVIAYFSTMWMTGLSMEEIYGYFDIRFICVLGFIESFVFISSLFYVGKGKTILSYYSGLMLIFPVTMMAFWMSRIVNGISFMAIGALASLATGALLMGITLFLHWLRCEKSWLYISTIVSLIIYILAFGIL